jgi:hypothetical protein
LGLKVPKVLKVHLELKVPKVRKEPKEVQGSLKVLKEPKEQ